MAYTPPSVQVTEEIANSGGTSATLPTINSVIVGPAYNVISYVVGDAAASTPAFAGVLSDSNQPNYFTLPSQKPGQVVDLTSFEVWADSTTCQTIATSGNVTAGSNIVAQTATAVAFTSLMPNDSPSIQPGFAVVATYSNGTTFSTTVLSTTNLAASGQFTTADIFPTTGTVSIVVTNGFNDIQISSTYYNTTDVGTTGQFELLPQPQTPYGLLVSGNIYTTYNALRTDISNTLLTFNNVGDLEGQLGMVTNSVNRLAVGIQCALANATGPIYGMATNSDNLIDWVAALEALENQQVGCLVPLTQQQDVIAAFQAHVDSMSLPENGDWRSVACNTAIATSEDIGSYSAGYPNTGASLTVNTSGSGYILTANNATFLSDGVNPSDIVVCLSGSIGNYIVQDVVSNQQLIVSGPSASATDVSYYVSRNLTKTQMAQNVADISTSFMDSRVWHVQPDIVGVPIGSTTEYLPGYYLAAAQAGQVATVPTQQGLTNLPIAGIADLVHSNFFFTKTQLNTMAGAGTCIYAQRSQGGVPYCRHELTTDMADIISQEIMITKNVDALQYYFKSLMLPFVGKFNITADTLQVMYQVLDSGATNLEKQKLPLIGAPLRSHQILSVAQNPQAADSSIIVIRCETPIPNNYVDITLVV